MVRFRKLEVLRRLPHPGRGFTQGLVERDGIVWESSGGYGTSVLYRYRLGATAPENASPLPPEMFGEGICLAGGQLWQLTWQERVALRWDPDSLELLDIVPYNRVGWGICLAGDEVVTSDGSSELVARDPGTLSPLRIIKVRLAGRRVGGLNDLAWAGDRVWANILGRRYLAGIEPDGGEVTDVVDARAVSERHWRDPQAVLNGIAALPVSANASAGQDQFLLTGKRWRRMYHVRLGRDRKGSLPPELLSGQWLS